MADLVSSPDRSSPTYKHTGNFSESKKNMFTVDSNNLVNHDDFFIKPIVKRKSVNIVQSSPIRNVKTSKPKNSQTKFDVSNVDSKENFFSGGRINIKVNKT